MATTQRRLLVLVLGAMAGVVVAASAAFACANLAAITLSTNTAAPGSTVEFRGDAFRDGPAEPQEEGPDAVTDVVVRWNSRSGEELWSGRSENRTVTGSFTVPDVSAGHYMVVATQYYVESGAPVAGAPARASIEVTGAPASSGAVASASAEQGGAAPAASDESAAPAPAPEEAPAPAAATTAPQQSTAAPSAAASTPEAPAATSAPAASNSGASAAAATPPAASDTGQAAPAAQPRVEVTSPHAMPNIRENVAAATADATSPALDALRSTAQGAATAPQASTALSSATGSPWWSVLPAAGWALLALALALGATLATSRGRRVATGLAVGRLS